MYPLRVDGRRGGGLRWAMPPKPAETTASTNPVACGPRSPPSAPPVRHPPPLKGSSPLDRQPHRSPSQYEALASRPVPVVSGGFLAKPGVPLGKPFPPLSFNNPPMPSAHTAGCVGAPAAQCASSLALASHGFICPRSSADEPSGWNVKNMVVLSATQACQCLCDLYSAPQLLQYLRHYYLYHLY